MPGAEVDGRCASAVRAPGRVFDVSATGCGRAIAPRYHRDRPSHGRQVSLRRQTDQSDAGRGAMIDDRLLRCPRHGIGVVVHYDATVYPGGCPVCAELRSRKAPDRPMTLREYDAEAL